MFIYEREHDEDRKIEDIIPDEIRNTCGMIELVQEVLSAKQGSKEELTTAKKNLTIASIKNLIADIMATEVKKLIASTTTMSSIVDFMAGERGVIPEIRMLSNDSNFLRQDIKFMIREDVYADIRFEFACGMQYVKVAFSGESGLASYGAWRFDCINKTATHVINRISIPGVNEPKSETVEFINNFMKKLCGSIGFGITSTGIFEIPFNNDLDRYTNTNPIPDIKDLPVPCVPGSFKFQENTMHGVCDNESEDDDECYDDDEYEYDDDYDDEDDDE